MSDDLMNRCPRCNVPWDDHLVRDARDHASGYNLPYVEPSEHTGSFVLDAAELCDQLDFVTSAARLTDQAAGLLGTRALGVVRFTFRSSAAVAPLGEHTLVMTDVAWRQLRTNLGNAIEGALRAARRQR